MPGVTGHWSPYVDPGPGPDLACGTAWSVRGGQLWVSQLLALLTLHSGPGGSPGPRARPRPRPATWVLWDRSCAGWMFQRPGDSDTLPRLELTALDSGQDPWISLVGARGQGPHTAWLGRRWGQTSEQLTVRSRQGFMGMLVEPRCP